MSATPQQSTASDHVRDPRDLYGTLVHGSAEVCSNCHARIRVPEHFEANRSVQNERVYLEHDTRDVATLGTGENPLDALERAAEGALGHSVEVGNPVTGTFDRYGIKRRHVPQTFCGSCGQPGGRDRDDPPGKSFMLDSIPSLIDRLDEAGVPCNEDRLYRYVDHLKSQERFTGRETEIWEAAVAKAVENARPRDCVRATYGREP